MRSDLLRALLPVIDLQRGQVVRGIAGQRESYRPIQSQLVASSSPADVALAFQRSFGFLDVYVADLDAIAGEPPDIASYHAIADAGMRLWIDAGTGGRVELDRLFRSCGFVGRAIVGLESVRDVAELRALAKVNSSSHELVFSLDLRNGVPMTNVPGWPHVDAIVEDVVQAGFNAMIVLDLSSVGVKGGPATLERCETLHREYPDLQLISGGGVRRLEDAQRLVTAGCQRVLIASALHDAPECFGEPQ